MTADAFEARVRRLEGWAASAPGLYKLGVVAWAVLGYLAIFAFLLGAVAILALLGVGLLTGHVLLLLKLGLKALIVIVPMIWVLLSSLFVRLPPPEGIPLRRAEHPALFALIDEARGPLRVREPDQVLLIPGLNAAVVELPRLGLLPWFRTYLLLGMPLLRSVSPVELKAILAHEFGHLSGTHGRLGSWIYRVRRSWDTIVQRVAQGEAGGGGLLMRFFFWYVPRFSAWSFTLARANEYEADRASAAVSSNQAAADALVRINIAAAAEQRFWVTLDRAILDSPQPPADLFEQLGGALGAAAEQRAAEGWLTRALGARTGVGDTHPALVDRLAALSEDARVPPPLAQDAATALLGDAAALEGALSQQWRGEIGPAWVQRRQQLVAMRDRLGELDAAVSTGSLAPDVLRERAALIGALRDEGEALAAWRVLLRLSPESNAARFHVGRLLLETDGDADEAVALLSAAADDDPDAVVPAAEVLVPWLRANRREGEAEGWLTRARAHLGAVEAQRAERATLSARDAFAPAGLSDAQRQRIADQLSTTDGVEGAWVARKVLEHSTEPLYILGVRLALTDGSSEASREAREVRWQLLIDTFDAPGEWLLVPLHHSAGIFRKLKAVDGAALPC